MPRRYASASAAWHLSIPLLIEHLTCPLPDNQLRQLTPFPRDKQDGLCDKEGEDRRNVIGRETQQQPDIRAGSGESPSDRKVSAISRTATDPAQ